MYNWFVVSPLYRQNSLIINKYIVIITCKICEYNMLHMQLLIKNWRVAEGMFGRSRDCSRKIGAIMKHAMRAEHRAPHACPESTYINRKALLCGMLAALCWSPNPEAEPAKKSNGKLKGFVHGSRCRWLKFSSGALLLSIIQLQTSQRGWRNRMSISNRYNQALRTSGSLLRSSGLNHISRFSCSSCTL